MNLDDRPDQLRDYLQIFRRRRWLMAAVLVTAVLAALFASLRATPMYEATTRIEVQPVSATSSEEVQILESLVDPGRSLSTQVELIQSEAVLAPAARTLGTTVRNLKHRMEVELVRDTQIVEIRVRHELPKEARDRAAAIADTYIDFRRDRAVEAVLLAAEEIGRRIDAVQTKIADQDRVLGDLKGAAARATEERDRLQAELATLEAKASAPQPSPAPPNRGLLKQIEDVRLRIGALEREIADYEGGGAGPKGDRDALLARLAALEAQRQALPDANTLRRGGGTVIVPARTPSVPVSPNIPRNLLLAGMLGVALAVGIAFVAEQLDDRIRSPEEVEERLGVPILGYVPLLKEWEKGARLAALDEESAVGAEAYRTLCTNMQYLSVDRPLRSVLVASSVAEEGKSTTAANLAVVSAQAGTRTLVISADLRRPGARQLFGVRGSPGLAQALDPAFPLHEALRETQVEGLVVLAEGGRPPNPTEILGSARFAQLLRSLSASAQLVVVDSPPVLGLADASVLASRVDGVLLVVNTRRVTRRALWHAADQLRKAGGRLIGVVMNAVQPHEGYGYYYHYSYYRYARDGQRTGAGETLRG